MDIFLIGGGYDVQSDGRHPQAPASPNAVSHTASLVPAFEELAAFQVGNAALAVRRHGSPGPVTTGNGQYVSGNFFKTFGISAWRGRLLTDADDQEGAPPVAVMSFHTWERKYGSDPSAVGAVYRINGRPFTIIGSP